MNLFSIGGKRKRRYLGRKTRYRRRKSGGGKKSQKKKSISFNSARTRSQRSNANKSAAAFLKGLRKSLRGNNRHRFRSARSRFERSRAEKAARAFTAPL